MGILLETVLPDRRFLIRLALWRFSVCAAAGAAAVSGFARPAYDAPLEWLLLTGLWLSMAAGWFFAGLAPLRFLWRRVEFYENGISAEPFDILLDQLELVRWKQEPFRLLGVFPLPFPPRERMICVCRSGKRIRRISVSGFYFSGLREAFDRAYEFSLTWEYAPYRKRRKKRNSAAPAAGRMGPAVPPSPPPRKTARDTDQPDRPASG